MSDIDLNFRCNFESLVGFNACGKKVNGKSPCSLGAVPIQAKAVHQNSACIDDQTAFSLQGLFAFKAAASDATEIRLVSASCTAKTKSKAGVKPAPLQRIYSLGLRAMIHTLRPRHRFIGGVADSFIR